jgi:hypothetical protein
VAGVDEVSGEQSAATADFEDESVPVANRGQQIKDARGARVGVESEPRARSRR